MVEASQLDVTRACLPDVAGAHAIGLHDQRRVRTSEKTFP